MLLREVLQTMDEIDSPSVSGASIQRMFQEYGLDVQVTKVTGDKGFTDFVQVRIPGTDGVSAGGRSRTLGIVGRLGGIGARPSRIGIVSDADGAVAAIAAGLKLARMHAIGDKLPGDVIISTHICPDAPTQPHFPVDFMDSPVDIQTMNEYEIHEDMDAILSIDTTKGNRIINHKGIAISPTVKDGYILKVSDDLVRVLEQSSGELAKTFPLSLQDITPYGNDVYHLNSILQPAVATEAPVVGVAITAVSAVPGCATGASHEMDIALAASYAVEVAKEFTGGKAEFYDAEEFARLQQLYGSMRIFRTLGRDQAE
ncbi:MAG: DUF1177 domain-containing protein [Tissierellia bacterium]|nr:DUF1177 domain-containing protein [Tissierellia bacterium]